MEYLTGCYCGDVSDAALVLVRVRRLRDDLPIVLAGVWEYAGEEAGVVVKLQQKSFGDILLDWFDEQGLPLCTKGVANKCIRAVGKNFTKWYDGYSRNEWDVSVCGKVSWSVFLSVGEECFYAWNGEGEIHLLNLCFNRLNRRKLTWHTSEMQLEFAGLEIGVGILLGTKSFFEYLPVDDLKECLAVAFMENNNQIARHLKEAAFAAISRGARQPMAVLAVTKEGRNGGQKD